MHLELTDEQTEALIRELSLIIEYDRYRLSPNKGTEGDPRDAAAEAAPRATSAAMELRAAEQGVLSATRLVQPLGLRPAVPRPPVLG